MGYCWTDKDQAIIDGRASGRPWNALAASLNVSNGCVRWHAATHLGMPVTKRISRCATDDRIRTLRAEHMSWDRIAKIVGMSRSGVIQRAKKIGAWP